MKRVFQTLDRYWFAEAPATRLAVLRILIGVFTLWYLLPRYSMFNEVAASDASLFEPVGAAWLLAAPIPVALFRALVVGTLVLNLAFILGWQHKYTGPLFGMLLLWVLCYRNSWSMLYHSDNALVIHVLILGVTRAADAYSLDALWRRREEKSGGWLTSWRYGWPIRLICAVTALTYFLAGFAKVSGPLGFGWGKGEALRGQIAVDGLRKELLDTGAPDLAFALYDEIWLFTMLGFGSLVLELGAPLALAHKRLSQLWALNVFLMHWGIFFIMGITFRYQLSGLIFASFFNAELLARGFNLSALKEKLVRFLPSQKAFLRN